MLTIDGATYAPGDLVRRATIAHRTGLIPQRLLNYQMRDSSYPAVVIDLDGIPYWEWAVVRRWLAERGLIV